MAVAVWMARVDPHNFLVNLSSDGGSLAGHRHSRAATPEKKIGVGPPEPAILLVEDDPQIAEMYRLRLQGEGLDVTIARDGEEALRLAATLAHDLILMDMGLPRRDGLEVIRELRADPNTATIPLAVLSNFSEPAMVQAATDLGVLAYMVKADTTPGYLAAAVRGWLTGGTLV